MKKLRVAIIGQGRSGRDIHGKFFKSEANIYCDVVAIVDAIEERRIRAREEFSCDVYADYRELFTRKDIDLVVNASFSHLHYSISRDLLEHGFNVLTEKPFARTSYECMELIRIAKKNNAVISAFHQTLFDPTFVKLKEIIASRKIGEVKQINLCYSGFARRWDWQTLQAFCGGGLYNSGPHPVAQALDFLGWDKATEIKFSKLDTMLTSGDANDYCKIILTAPSKPVIDLEVISANGFAGETFRVLGTKGSVSARGNTYTIKYIKPEELEPRPVIFTPLFNENRCPAYCSEKLNIYEETETLAGSNFTTSVQLYYEQLYNSIVNNTPLTVTPEMATEVIRVIEEVHAKNPLPVIYGRSENE